VDTEWAKKVYNFYSGFYDAAFSWVVKPHLRKAFRELNLKGGEKILEIGIGTGLSLKYYPKDCFVTGVDLSPNMLKKAEDKANNKNLANVKLHVMDATDLVFNNSSFDYIIAGFVISVCSTPHLVIKEMKRVLKDSGRIVFINHFMSKNTVVKKVEKTVNPLTKKIGWRMDISIDDIFNDTGITLERVIKLNKIAPWSIVIARKDF